MFCVTYTQRPKTPLRNLPGKIFRKLRSTLLCSQVPPGSAWSAQGPPLVRRDRMRPIVMCILPAYSAINQLLIHQKAVIHQG